MSDVIEISAKDYLGFASAGLDRCVPGRHGKPSGAFNRRVEVFLGAQHVNLTHYEWGIELHGGPKLRAVYLEARPSFGSCEDSSFKPMALVRFVERELVGPRAGTPGGSSPCCEAPSRQAKRLVARTRRPEFASRWGAKYDPRDRRQEDRRAGQGLDGSLP